MKCKDFDTEKINRYIDGEFDMEEKGILENHFKSCEFCRNYLKELQDSVSIIKKGKSEMEVPGEVWERVRKGVRSVNRQRFIWRYILVPVSAMAVFLFVFILTGREDIDKTVNDYIAEQMSYLNGEPLVDSWYLEEPGVDYVADVFMSEWGMENGEWGVVDRG